jgi:protein translocase SecG subunit
MVEFLPHIQIILSLLLIGGILLQQSEAGLGSAFGGGTESSMHHTRRGFEKFSFYLTIIISILFAATAFASLLVSR